MNCDGTHGSAGAFGESFPDEIDAWIDPDVRASFHTEDDWEGCIYCTSWPNFCTALEVMKLEALEDDLSWMPYAVESDEETAASAAQAATEAALAASELAIAAAVKAEEARKLAATAQTRAEALARARATANELAARVRR